MPALAFSNEQKNQWVVDHGRYGIQVSTSSASSGVQPQGFINVSGALKPVLSVITAEPTMPGDAARDIHDRLMFPTNTNVQPNLTISLSNDQSTATSPRVKVDRSRKG